MSKYVTDTNPVMSSNRSQVAVKRLTCCNILGSPVPSGINVSFKNIFSEIVSEINQLEDRNYVYEEI